MCVLVSQAVVTGQLLTNCNLNSSKEKLIELFYLIFNGLQRLVKSSNGATHGAWNLMQRPPVVLQNVRQYSKKTAGAATLRRTDSDSDSDSDDEFERRRKNANVKRSERVSQRTVCLCDLSVCVLETSFSFVSIWEAEICFELATAAQKCWVWVGGWRRRSPWFVS